MQITTTDFIPGCNITNHLDTVFSEQILSINAIKDVVHSIKGISAPKWMPMSKNIALSVNKRSLILKPKQRRSMPMR